MPRKGPATETIQRGRLRIGDDWHAIELIARSQANPLKAIAEMVENSIDAKATHIAIVRGRAGGELYLRVGDDGRGVPMDAEGNPDFRYVATHICDSIKRRLEDREKQGVHGEFGIGLLGFWSLGEELRMVSRASSGGLQEMTMRRSQRTYAVVPVRGALPLPGCEVTVSGLHAATRNLVTGEKIQRYLAAELRDRIRATGVAIDVEDKVARKSFVVRPREFEGERIDVPRRVGEVSVELYLRYPREGETMQVAVCRDGVRVKTSLLDLPGFDHEPWTLNRFEGILDFAGLRLAAGQRESVAIDERFEAFGEAVRVLEPLLVEIVRTREEADLERASRSTLQSIARAIREAIRELPDDYAWFDVAGSAAGSQEGDGAPVEDSAEAEASEGAGERSLFDERPGPLASLTLRPAKATVEPGSEKPFAASARDANGRRIDVGVAYLWRIAEGAGALRPTGRRAIFVAPPEPGVARVEVLAESGDVALTAEAEITIGRMDARTGNARAKGLPEYVLVRHPAEAWRSRYDAEKNRIEVNTGHRDYVACRTTAAAARRYIAKLYAKEIVLQSFPDATGASILERMIELLQRMESRL
ncbi:MAG: ATP-binding protein [Planctomycetes bacterium]|nr:ATP-binding protein [Planctomycetota bacterium]MBI3843661.1 ATP-binding protein [Planctomycetota bacterium]